MAVKGLSHLDLKMHVCIAEIFLIENQQSATDTIRGPCLFVDSKTDGANIKVTGCNDTDERQNWAYTLKGQIMVRRIHSDYNLRRKCWEGCQFLPFKSFSSFSLFQCWLQLDFFLCEILG